MAKSDLKTYIWAHNGDLQRRENGNIVRYVKGDAVEMTPEGAYQNRGKLLTEGGLMIPDSMFDGKSHPMVEKPKPSSPHRRREMSESATAVSSAGVMADSETS